MIHLHFQVQTLTHGVFVSLECGLFHLFIWICVILWIRGQRNLGLKSIILDTSLHCGRTSFIPILDFFLSVKKYLPDFPEFP